MSIVLCFLNLLCLVRGHGNMVKPAVWSDSERKEWYYDEDGNINNIGCHVLDYPEDTEYEEWTGMALDCLPYWFSNKRYIPGNATIPFEHSQPDVRCASQDLKSVNSLDKYPWMAPGSAPVFSPCGAMGGLPYGCNHDGVGNLGDICNDCNCNCNCGSFAMGGLAENYEWPDPPTTQWKAGSIEEVAWYITVGNHGGGYSYRLCKTPEGGISDLTEECFQNGYLEFVGENQWVNYEADRYSRKLTEITAKRFTEGTFPPGSMWTEVPFYPFYYQNENVDGEFDKTYGFGHIIDNVNIPSTLVPGDYVLSMRYDCKCVPEVFSFCANIQIIE